MKINSKPIVRTALGLSLSLALVPSASMARPAFANNSPQPSVSTSPHPGVGHNACARLSSVSQSQGKDFDGKVNKLNQDLAANTAKEHQTETTDDATITNQRKSADELRQKHFDKLNADASTDTQKAAVAAFQTAVQDAVTTRRAAVDQAQQTFRAGVASVVAKHQAAIKAAVVAYHTAVSQALATAKASCAAGTDPTTVQQTLRTALQSAHAALRAAISAIGNPGSQIKQLATTRNAAIKAADQAFTQAINQAATTLKAALGQTDTSPSPSPSDSVTPSPSV